MEIPSSTKQVIHQVNLMAAPTLLAFLVTHKLVKRTLPSPYNGETETWSIELRDDKEKT